MTEKLKSNLIKKIWLELFLLQFVPFIRMIAITGSVMRGTATSHSDIDVFIITEKKRLWIVRFFSIFILDFFDMRAKEDDVAGKICLNRFASNEDYQITPQNQFHAGEYSRIVPIFYINDTYQKFQNTNKEWMEKFDITCHLSLATRQLNNFWLPKIIRSFSEIFLAGKIGDWLEKQLKSYQVRIIKSNTYFHQPNSRLKTTNQEFYFHHNPK